MEEKGIILQLSKEALFDGIDQIIERRLSTLSPQSKETLITRKQLATGDWPGGISVSIPTQDKYRRKGLLKVVQIGGKVMYRESDLLAALTEKKGQ